MGQMRLIDSSEFVDRVLGKVGTPERDAIELQIKEEKETNMLHSYNSVLDKQIKFYDEHIDSLLQDYEGSILVISEDCKVDAFSNYEEAYTFGVENYGLGNFLMRECRKKESCESHIITPNVVVL